MAEFPVDASLAEIESLRVDGRKPYGRPRPFFRGDGQPPDFRGHGMADGRAIACIASGEWKLRCARCPAIGPGLDRFGNPLRVYVCPLCSNEASGKRPCETLWPTLVYRRSVLEILNVRPKANRNWFPWRETTDDLRQENEKHGLPVAGPLLIIAA